MIFGNGQFHNQAQAKRNAVGKMEVHLGHGIVVIYKSRCSKEIFLKQKIEEKKLVFSTEMR